MKQAIDQLVAHYTTVVTGESGFFPEALAQLCFVHKVTVAEACDAIARDVAEKYVAGELDADRAAFAADDLHHAAEFELTGFARKVIEILEYREASRAEVAELLKRGGADNAA
jgi:hypothetical protein